MVTMQLRPGIPLTSEVERLTHDPYYTDLAGYNRQFLSRHGKALEGYGKLWGQDPFRMWSRRWEYPFEVQKVSAYLDANPGRPMKMLDGGSGVTYVPYLLAELYAELSVICCDTNTSYAPMFSAINQNVGNDRVSFQEAKLQELPYEAASLDVVCCMSVLEHTDNYAQIVNEFARVTRPGGLLVLTFDLSLDGKFRLDKPTATDLLNGVSEHFVMQETLNAVVELNRMTNETDAVLNTRHVKQTEPDLLPWRYPLLKAAKDVLDGHGWTGGFRYKTVFCLSAVKK